MKEKLENQENMEEAMFENVTDESNEEENKDYGNKLVLHKPIEVDGENIKEIEYDFNSVKPIQYINLVAKLSKKGQISVPELDLNVQIGFFSLASGIPVSDLKRMSSVQDFTIACGKARDFLLGASDTETEED